MSWAGERDGAWQGSLGDPVAVRAAPRPTSLFIRLPAALSLLSALRL
jgi:hypothetical protein